MTFLYGNNVTKAGLARITDGIPQYGGVIVYRFTYSLTDVLTHLLTYLLTTIVCQMFH